MIVVIGGIIFVDGVVVGTVNEYKYKIKEGSVIICQ